MGKAPRIVMFSATVRTQSNSVSYRGECAVFSLFPKRRLGGHQQKPMGCSGLVQSGIREHQYIPAQKAEFTSQSQNSGSVHLESLEFTCGLQSVSKAFTHCFLYPWRLYITHLTENKFAIKEKPPTSVRLFFVNDHFKNKGKLVTLSQRIHMLGYKMTPFKKQLIFSIMRLNILQG